MARECSAPCSRSTRTASSHPCSHERVRATLKAADRIDLVRSRGTAAYPSSSMARSSSVALRCAPEMSAARKLATVCSNDDIESSRRIARFDAALYLPPRTAVCRAETCSPPHLGTPDGTITIFLGINVVSCPGGSGTHHPVATMSTGQFEMEPGEIDPYGYVIAAIGFACFTHFYGSIKVRYYTHSR